MTLAEAQELKQELEGDIMALLTEFSNKTKCTVDGVHLDGGPLIPIGSKVPTGYVYLVEVVVKL